MPAASHPTAATRGSKSSYSASHPSALSTAPLPGLLPYPTVCRGVSGAAATGWVQPSRHCCRHWVRHRPASQPPSQPDISWLACPLGPAGALTAAETATACADRACVSCLLAYLCTSCCARRQEYCRRGRFVTSDFMVPGSSLMPSTEITLRSTFRQAAPSSAGSSRGGGASSSAGSAGSSASGTGTARGSCRTAVAAWQQSAELHWRRQLHCCFHRLPACLRFNG